MNEIHPLQALSILLEEASRSHEAMKKQSMTLEQLKRAVTHDIFEFTLRSTDVLAQVIYVMMEDIDHVRALTDGSQDSYIAGLEELLSESVGLLLPVSKDERLEELYRKQVINLMDRISQAFATDDEPKPPEPEETKNGTDEPDTTTT